MESYRALKPDIKTRTIKVNLRRLDTILAGSTQFRMSIRSPYAEAETWLRASATPAATHDADIILLTVFCVLFDRNTS